MDDGFQVLRTNGRRVGHLQKEVKREVEAEVNWLEFDVSDRVGSGEEGVGGYDQGRRGRNSAVSTSAVDDSNGSPSGRINSDRRRRRRRRRQPFRPQRYSFIRLVFPPPLSRRSPSTPICQYRTSLTFLRFPLEDSWRLFQIAGGGRILQVSFCGNRSSWCGGRGQNRRRVWRVQLDSDELTMATFCLFDSGTGRGGRSGRNNYVNPSNIPSISNSAAGSPLTLLGQMPSSSSMPQLFVPSSFPVPDSAPVSDFVSPAGNHEPQPPLAEASEPFLYNTSQLTNPVPHPPGRLASRGRYPR